MSTYAGQDPIASPVVTAGEGTWPDLITIPDDGDPRAAASVNVALEGLADRTQWLGQRMVNAVLGGTYAVAFNFTNLQFTIPAGSFGYVDGTLSVRNDGVISLNGASGFDAEMAFGAFSLISHFAGSREVHAGLWTMQGDAVYANGSTSTYQNGSSVSHASGSTDTYQNLATVTFSAGSTMNQNGDIARTGKVALSGTGAFTALRIETGPDLAVANIDGRDQDILEVPTLTLPSAYTLTNLPVGDTCSFKIRVATTTALDIKRQSGTIIASFAVSGGSFREIEFYWTDTLWRVGIVGAEFANL